MDVEAVIVAGDIGDEIVTEFFPLLESSFSCPIYYVYGNWDHKLNYKAVFSKNSTHLHQEIIEVEDYFLTGFSGCAANWGKNTVALHLYSEVDKKYPEIVDKLKKLKTEYSGELETIDKMHNEYVDELKTKSKDRRKKTYKQKIRSAENKRWRDKEKAYSKIQSFRDSKKFEMYAKEKLETYKFIEKENKHELSKSVKNSGYDPTKFIIVTHDRFYRLGEFLNKPLLNLFGHKHGFKENYFKGTYYVNVSVLDNIRFVYPENEKLNSENLKKVNSGNSTLIDIQSGVVKANKLDLSVNLEKYRYADLEGYDRIVIEFLKQECDFIEEDKSYI